MEKQFLLVIAQDEFLSVIMVIIMITLRCKCSRCVRGPRIQLTSSFNLHSNYWVQMGIIFTVLLWSWAVAKSPSWLSGWVSAPPQGHPTSQPLLLTPGSSHLPSSFPPATDRYRPKCYPPATFCGGVAPQVGTQVRAAHGPTWHFQPSSSSWQLP